jgi:nickel superoxide dismutase
MKNAMLVTTLLGGLLVAVQARAHCEIPCGIYGDDTRFTLMAEHISTIEKSMQSIIQLSKQKKVDYNQLVRWVTNKETHAEKLQEIVSQYFMHQRIKPVGEEDPGYKSYVTQLTLAHQIAVTAMKTKQTTDLKLIAELRSLLDKFRHAYQGK